MHDRCARLGHTREFMHVPRGHQGLTGRDQQGRGPGCRLPGTRHGPTAKVTARATTAGLPCRAAGDHGGPCGARRSTGHARPWGSTEVGGQQRWVAGRRRIRYASASSSCIQDEKDPLWTSSPRTPSCIAEVLVSYPVCCMCPSSFKMVLLGRRTFEVLSAALHVNYFVHSAICASKHRSFTKWERGLNPPCCFRRERKPHSW